MRELDGCFLHAQKSAMGREMRRSDGAGSPERRDSIVWRSSAMKRHTLALPLRHLDVASTSEAANRLVNRAFSRVRSLH